jgi:hypothetical protein
MGRELLIFEGQAAGGQAEGGRLIFVTFPHMRSPFRHFSIAVHQVVCSPICMNLHQK